MVHSPRHGNRTPPDLSLRVGRVDLSDQSVACSSAIDRTRYSGDLQREKRLFIRQSSPDQNSESTSLTGTILHNVLVCNLQKLERLSSRYAERGHVCEHLLAFAPALVNGVHVNLVENRAA